MYPCIGTTPGNNSYISYNVSYNDSELVLICHGDDDRAALWMKHDGSVLCPSHNFTLNSDRSLTNDDSGVYICRTSVATGTEYHFVHINVLGEKAILANRPIRVPRVLSNIQV